MEINYYSLSQWKSFQQILATQFRSFKTSSLQTNRQKEDKYRNENSIVASLLSVDLTIVTKMEHPVSQKLKTAKSKFFIDM